MIAEPGYMCLMWKLWIDLFCGPVFVFLTIHNISKNLLQHQSVNTLSNLLLQNATCTFIECHRENYCLRHSNASKYGHILASKYIFQHLVAILPSDIMASLLTGACSLVMVNPALQCLHYHFKGFLLYQLSLVWSSLYLILIPFFLLSDFNYYNFHIIYSFQSGHQSIISY